MVRSILRTLTLAGLFLTACTAEEKVVEPTDFAFDGTCINCHAGLTAGHVHTNYKLRCIDCHGGNDQVDVPAEAFDNKSLEPGGGGFRDPLLIKQAHVAPDPNIARMFFANGIDDDGDGSCFNDHTIKCTEDDDCGAGNKCQLVDEPIVFDNAANPTQLIDQGEVFEPGLHGEGPGEFVDAELNRDLNYTRFLNPGDLRIAAISCGAGSRGAFDGGGGGACHQQTIDIVRRGIMVNQAAVTNGAYYGNESFRTDFINARDDITKAPDPRFGAFGYGLDYGEADSVDSCIRPPPDGNDPRSQPFYDKECLQDRAAEIDAIEEKFGGNSIVAGAQGNIGVLGEQPSNFEIGQANNLPPAAPPGETLLQVGAGDTRFTWGGQAATGDGHDELQPLLNDFLLPPGLLPTAPNGVPDPVDNILRTFRAYYPLNYPASTNNFNFTFGTSILPEIARFRTGTAYGRGHSSGCSACHTPYNYEGNRQAQLIRNEDPQDLNGNGKLDQDELFTAVVDPTTKHREFDPANDIGKINGIDRLIGRPVSAAEVAAAGAVAQGAVDIDGDGVPDGEQEKTYSAKHEVTAKIDTDTCGLCHGFVTRINYAYQGMAEEEQRDSLARRAPIEFTTPNGTNVEILDSWIREDNDINNDGAKDAQPTLVVPDGVEIVNLARDRDAKLAEEGFQPGFGGCVPAVFTEDCNNNGELDADLVLEKIDEDGNVIATTTIDEDLNGNGKLDLIDRLPREKAIDGRQVRYVYGGRNGSTRQMDVHFQVGMHCIDCHFLQDVHGDGQVYSTNWDLIEIECEDCHGANNKTNFKTSGPNGGNDMRLALNEDLLPFFEERDGKVIQRSRVTTGLAWEVPQTIDINEVNPYAKEAHDPEYHVAEPGEGSEFAMTQGTSELTVAKVECQVCHNGFVTNCLGCHVEINVGDKQRNRVFPDGHIEKSAGENEIWLSNKHNGGHINFQLLGLLRGSVVMNQGGASEKGRLNTVRSSMEVMAGASDENGDTIRENLTFTTFQTLDANSGRKNVATSGVAMNQTMAHTVRPAESRGCELCHSLVDDNGRVRNEGLMAQTMGLGAGAVPFTGDWLLATGANGLEMFEYKQERELANNFAAGVTRFPGLIVNGNNGNRVAANVEPLLDGTQANDVVLIRNFNPEPPLGATAPPSLRDLAVVAVNQGGQGRLVLSDVSFRGHPSLSRRSDPANNNDPNVDVVALAGVPLSLAHIASDVSDPFVYAAIGNDGVQVVKITGPTSLADQPSGVAGQPFSVGGETAIEVALAGDLLYVGTLQGNIHVFNINDPQNLQEIGSVSVGAAVVDISVSGFVLYVATPSGLTALVLDDPANPAPPAGANGIQFVGPPATGVAFSEGFAFVAAGAQGVHQIDARTVAAMKDLGSIVPAGQNVNANDVIVSLMPGQKWIVALEDTGDVVGIKIDGRQNHQEKCFQDNGFDEDCLLEFDSYDPTHSGRDPSFDPIAGVFDDPNIDPSAVDFFRLNRAILGGNGRRLARPVYWEAIGTLTGRRYRDSFMPGSGVLSLPVMQAMRAIQVCEIPGAPSTNPSGLDGLGYFIDGVCQEFGTVDFKPQRTCQKKNLGPGIRSLVCQPRQLNTAVDPQQAKPADPPRALPPVSASAVGAVAR